MSRKNILLVLSAALFLCCCTKEKGGKDTPGEGGEDVHGLEFRVEVEAMPDGSVIQFRLGDQMAVWDGAKIRKFTAVETRGELVFCGTVLDAEKYWALYPWRDDCSVSIEQGVPVFSSYVPEVQLAGNGRLDSSTIICTGQVGPQDGVLKMKNVCMYIQAQLPKAPFKTLEPGSLSRMIFAADPAVRLSGAFSVYVNDQGIPQVNVPELEEGSAVELSFENEDACAEGLYSISILPAELNGKMLKVTSVRSEDDAVACFEVALPQTASSASGKIINLGTIGLDWSALSGEEPDDESPTPSGAIDYSLLEKTCHPRLLMCDGDFKNLNESLSKGDYPELVRQHLRTLGAVDALLGEPIPTLNQIKSEYPEFKLQKNRHLELLARPVLERLYGCSYAYRTTRQKKYLDECVRVVSQILSDSNWYPESFLSTAEIAMGVAIAYDWLYYDLSYEMRQQVREALVGKAILARGEKTLYYDNNTGQVHNAGLLAAALAVYEKDKSNSSEFINESYPAVRDIVRKIYRNSGSTYEGYSYWGYGTNFQILYNECLMSAVGGDSGLCDIQGFKKSGEFMLYLADGVSTFSYADGGRSSSSYQPAMWWYAAHYRDSRLLYNELALYSKLAGKTHRLMPLVPCTLSKNPAVNSTIVPLAQEVWVDDNDAVAPVVMVRRSMGDAGEVYLGLKGGSAGVNHGHMDAGSFVYHSKGKVWCSDVQQKTYSEYTVHGLEGHDQMSGTWKALVYSSLGHSTMSFSNYSASATKIHPTDHIVAGKALITNAWTTGAELGGELDLTPLYDGQVASATRKAVINADGDLVVTDRIKALPTKDAQLIWRLVTPAAVSEEDGHFVLSQGDESVSVSMICSMGSVNQFAMCNWGLFKDARPVDGQWGWSEVPVWDEDHKASIIGYTMIIPKNKEIELTSIVGSASFAPEENNVSIEELTDSGQAFEW